MGTHKHNDRSSSTPGVKRPLDKLRTVPRGSRRRQGRARVRRRKEKGHQEWSGITTRRRLMHAGLNEYVNK